LDLPACRLEMTKTARALGPRTSSAPPPSPAGGRGWRYGSRGSPEARYRELASLLLQFHHLPAHFSLREVELGHIVARFDRLQARPRGSRGRSSRRALCRGSRQVVRAGRADDGGDALERVVELLLHGRGGKPGRACDHTLEQWAQVWKRHGGVARLPTSRGELGCVGQCVWVETGVWMQTAPAGKAVKRSHTHTHTHTHTGVYLLR
jgi:hypothetical protein